jgi:hypothetical protein
VAFVEDFSCYLADFGVPATLAGASVRVIFEAAGAVLGGMSALQPAVQLPTADVPADYAGAALVVGGLTYTVAEHQPDGTGWSTLLLQRAA